MVFDPTSSNLLDGTKRKAISSGGQVNVLPAPSASMIQLLSFLPAPNFGAPGDVANNFAAGFSEKFDAGQYDGRIDYSFSEAHHFFGRYSIADFTKESPGAYGEVAGGASALHFAGRSLVRHHSLAFGW